MRGSQLSFLPKLPTAHGGSLLAGKRKGPRPIDNRQAMHIVLRSTRARGAWSMLHSKHRRHVDAHVQKIADRHGVRLYRYANVGNHLHLLVKTRTRTAFRRFLRDLAGTIAAIVTGAKKGNPLAARALDDSSGAADSGKFWDTRAYTRIVSFGRDFENLKLYFIQNLFEAAGLLSRKAKAAGLRPIPLMGWAVSRAGPGLRP